MQLTVTFNDNNGDVEIGPLDRLIDMDPTLAAEFLDIAVEAMQTLRLEIKPWSIAEEFAVQ